MLNVEVNFGKKGAKNIIKKRKKNYISIIKFLPLNQNKTFTKVSKTNAN